MRISFPMRRLASAGDDHRGTSGWTIRTHWHRGGEVHQGRNATQDTLRVISEANELPQIGFAAQVHDVAQRRVIMADLADLNEKDFASEMIDDLLVAPPVPPFDGEIKLATGIYNPERK